MHENSEPSQPTASARHRLLGVESAVARACLAAARARGQVQLVAVSKTFDASEIEPVLAAGHRAFGENRVQEAGGKWPELRERYPGVALHLIGPLQSNKTREAVELFDAVHSVDRPKIAEALAREIQRVGRSPELFVQVNTGAEAQKAGVLPEETDAFVRRCATDYDLQVAGLMCIPPADENPAPHFALLEKIARRNGLVLLSMGMSGDFEIAIAHGATHVRVGSAIFGSRPPLGQSTTTSV